MELWTEVADFPNYEVSSLGQVRRKGAEEPKKVCCDGGGYLKVDLYEGGRQTTCKVHRLVALAFIPNPEGKEQVDHINRIRTDNRLENLRWASRSENNRNTGRHSDNQSGYKNIDTTFMTGGKYEYWRIKIQGKAQYFNKDAWTLQQVVDIRNNLYEAHGLERYD
jgi:hypothetical protein